MFPCREVCRVRTLMAAIAAASLFLTWGMMRSRSKSYRKAAIAYSRIERFYNDGKQLPLLLLDIYEKEHAEMLSIRGNTSWLAKENKQYDDMSSERIRVQRGEVIRLTATAAHYSQLRRKYEYAADHPWLSIAHDPPPPEPDLQGPYWFVYMEYGKLLAALDETIRLSPTDVEANNRRARILATCPDPAFRDGQRAIETATRACESSSWKDPRVLDTLAAAYAEALDFDSAIKWQKEALVKLSAHNPDAKKYKARLVLYKSGKPYRVDPAFRDQ
jgi:hypothetical protein